MKSSFASRAVLLMSILFSSLAYGQNTTDSSPTTIFNGYKGFAWGTTLDEFLTKKGCGSGNLDCVQNVDKKDIASFRSSDVGDEATFKKLVALGIAMRDIALGNYLGKNCKVTLTDNANFKSAEMTIPDIFDSVFMKSEGVVYFFINKELAGAFAILDSKDIQAGKQLMQSKMDSIEKNHVGFYTTPIQPALGGYFEIRRSKTPSFFTTHGGPGTVEVVGYVPAKFDFYGAVDGTAYPFNDSTTGCILTIQEGYKKYGILNTGMPAAGAFPKGNFVALRDLMGGLAYWDNVRLKGFIDSFNKSYSDQNNAVKAKEQEKEKEHYDDLKKTNPNFQ